METRYMDKFVGFIIVLMPLIINPMSIDSFYYPKVILLYGVCIWIIYILLRKGINKRLLTTRSDYIIIIYFAYIMISTILSVNIYQSIIGAEFRWEGFATLACYVIVYLVTSKFYYPQKRHLDLAIASSMIIAMIGILQCFGKNPLQFNYIRWHMLKNFDYTTIGNRNFVGSYITLIMPISLFFFLYYEKDIYLLTSTILYLLLLCMNTRSSWLAALFYILALFYFAIRFKLSLRRFLIVISLFFTITMLFNLNGNNQFINRIKTIKSDAISMIDKSEKIEEAGSGRIFIWTRVIQLIKERPILGCGPDTLEIVFMSRYKTNPLGAIIDKAHNEYLQIAATMGIPALIIYLAFITVIVLKCYRAIKTNLLAIPLFCSITGYLLQAFFNISVVSVAPIFWLFLGIAGSPNLSKLVQEDTKEPSAVIAYNIETKLK